MKRFVTTLILYVSLISQSFAIQNDFSKNTQKNNINSSSEFIFESYPNQELVPIRLLGAIKNAGLYHVPSDMKLTTLLALAGGTTNDADLENIIIGNDQQLVNYNGILKKKNMSINLEESFKNTENDYTLVSNDIVLIKNKTPWISSDSARGFSLISILLTSVLTAVIIKDKTSK